MLWKRKLMALCLVLLMTAGLALTAQAMAIDTTRKGTITVTVEDDGKPVPGGKLTLYRVGEIRHNNGTYTFAPAGDFASCGLDFSDVQSPALAKNLAKYAKDQKLSGVKTLTVDKSGKAVFQDLELGLYLCVQPKAAPGYYALDSFLVSLPTRENDEYRYEVDASPKVEADPKPTKPTDPNLPQTGQLNWPIPVLAGAGMVLFAAGWALCFRKKEAHEG